MIILVEVEIMAKYTIELRSLVGSGYQIFDDTWDTFLHEHKQELCSKIIRHYWFYEIGSETADRFKHNLNEHLASIMPYYNQLYASELLKLEPLFDRYIEETEGIKANRGRTRGTSQRRDINSLREMAESIRKLSQGTSNLVGNKNMQGHETWKENRTINTTEVTDQDTTEDTTKKVEFSENVASESKEVMNDQVNGDKTTDGTSKTTTSGERRYSDTPQGEVGTSGVEIDKAYLTNYTKESGNSDTTTHQEEKITNTEDKTTDTTSTKDTTSTEDTTQNVKGTNDITKTTDTTDDVSGSRDKTENTDETEDVKTTSKEHDFSNGSQSELSSSLSYTGENEDENEKRDRTNLIKGFSVAQSTLLIEYRKTFLNIDLQIINELITDFMGVF